MENHDNKTQDTELRPAISAASRGRTQPLRANMQNRPFDNRLLRSNLPTDQAQSDNDVPSASDVQVIEMIQASGQYSTVGDPHQLQKAQAAFSANAEVIATTPRRTAWKGENPILSSQNTGHLTEEHQNQEWTPRLALGSINADRIGAKEAARRHMLQWDKIYEFNEIQDPGSLNIVGKHRTEARRVYEELLARGREEDSLPRNELASYQNQRIQARSALLWKTLLEAPEEGCEPMKANITAALKGYNTGAIGFSNNYTLIFAGQIVDTTCATYTSFTIDRQERLDQYFEEHGPGYLWWEPPLAKGRERVLTKKSTVLNLDREEESSYIDHQQGYSFQDDACHYKVPLGFKKDDSMRRRLRDQRRRSVVAKESHPEPVFSGKRKREKTEKSCQESGRSKRAKPTARGEGSGCQGVEEASAGSIPYLQEDSTTTKVQHIECDAVKKGESPTIFFDMLLDSGAELPILLHDDFEILGYSEQDMNAASVVELNAAAGQTSTALCFELLVGLELQGSPSESWIDQVAYSEAHFFPCRVVKLPPTVKTPAYGAFSGDRLSGIMPFLAYYMASAPGNNRLCLGEKRAEVLSIQNMPAGLNYDPFNDPSTVTRARRRELMSKIHEIGGEIQGLRKVTFETDMGDGRKLVDEDAISVRGEEVSSKIGLISQHGDLIDSWNQGHAKSKASLKQR